MIKLGLDQLTNETKSFKPLITDASTNESSMITDIISLMIAHLSEIRGFEIAVIAVSMVVSMHTLVGLFAKPVYSFSMKAITPMCFVMLTTKLILGMVVPSFEEEFGTINNTERIIDKVSILHVLFGAIFMSLILIGEVSLTYQ